MPALVFLGPILCQVFGIDAFECPRCLLPDAFASIMESEKIVLTSARGWFPMKVDGRDLPSGHQISCDLCIVGAGAAGITIARSFENTKFQICVLEAGGFKYDPKTQDLYAGEASREGSAKPIDDYLIRSRLRLFGGTTNHWTGWCRPLDDLDFEKRPWVPNSGWPIRKSDLAKYYRTASAVLEIPPFDDGLDEGNGWNESEVLLDCPDLTLKRFHMSPPTRFGTLYRNDLVAAKNIRLVLNANVTKLQVNPEASVVREIHVATLTGIRIKVKARVLVLATGGIENARILLLSDDVQSEGLGNRTDNVGRYFMEHPRFHRSAFAILTADKNKVSTLQRKNNLVPVYCLSPEAQRRMQLVNANVLFHRNDMSFEGMDKVIRMLDAFRDTRSSGDVAVAGRCTLRMEQSPNRESRVSLMPERDALGLRRVKLDWRFGKDDWRTANRVLSILGTALGRHSLGRLRINLTQKEPWKPFRGAKHHLGTTRMSESPRKGVVDKNCNVFGVSNLYIAGSSVFTAGGSANPTFTLVALALRLADHLEGVLSV